MERTLEWREAVQGIWDGLLAALSDVVPRLLLGVGVLVVGLVLARVIQVSLRVILRKARFDVLMERAGVSPFLNRMGYREGASHLLARAAYYVLVLLLLQTVFDILGLEVVVEAIGHVIAYVPNVLAATVVILLGYAIGRIAGRVVAESAGSTGAPFARALGQVVQAVIVVVFAMMAMSQLELETLAIQGVALVLLGGFILSAALSFGLGTRDIVRSIAAGFYHRRTLRPGQELEFRGQKVILRNITPLEVLLEKGDRVMPVSNWALLQERDS